MKIIRAVLKRLRGEWVDKPAQKSVAPINGDLLTPGELLRPSMILVALVVAVVLSAVAVAYSAFEYRRVFNSHQILVKQEGDLQVEWSQLLLEESAWGGNSRVERLAHKQLDMIRPAEADIEIVRHEH